MTPRRRRLALLAGFAVMLVPFLVWKGSWGPPRESDTARTGTAPDGGPLAARLRGVPTTGRVGQAAEAGDADGDPAPFPATLQGRVVDAETGDSIPTARFFLWPRGEPPPDVALGETASDVLAESRVVRARRLYPVDGQGRLLHRGGFERIGRGRPLDIHVFAPGYLYTISPVDIPGRARVELVPGETLRGRVVDPEGRPVPDARVRPWGFVKQTGVLRWFPVGSATTTGAEGRFELPGVESYVYIQAEAPSGRLSKRVAVDLGPERPFELVVDHDVVVTLNVRTEDGNGMLWAEVKEPDVWWSRTLWRTPWGEAAPSERSIGFLPLPSGPRPAEILVRVPGYVPRLIDVPPDASPREIDVIMTRPRVTGNLSLRLTWPPGLDEAGAAPVFVRLRNTALRWKDDFVVVARHVVPPGTPDLLIGTVAAAEFEVLVVGRDIASVEQSVTVGYGGPTVHHVDLQAACALEVEFEDAPATGVRFSLWFAAPGDPFPTRHASVLQRQEGELTIWGEEVLPDGHRWGSDFVAAPDETGAATARVVGLAPRRYEISATSDREPQYERTVVDVEPGALTRVTVQRSRN